jgi:hypothetical protein
MSAVIDPISPKEQIHRAPGTGLTVTSSCDQCGKKSGLHRKRAKVKRGPLRGLMGMVCKDCTDEARNG